jgi:hypothetical protein
LEHAQFPGLYRSADSLSLSYQKRFFVALFTHLTALVLAAAVSAVNSPTWQSALLQALLLLTALGCSIYLAACRPDKYWYAARAIAESIKTMTWRYVSVAEPFDKDDQLARAEFRNKLKALLEQNRDVAAKLINHLQDMPISRDMDVMRAGSLDERRQRYLDKRITNQLGWYAKKAKFNANASKLSFALLVSANVIAVVLAVTRIKFHAESIWPTDVFIAIAACLLTWMQAKRFSELSTSYALAAHEINFVRGKAGEVNSPSDFSLFVADAENAFSREHTQWVARQDV